jgi:hypothetical protein
VKAREWLAAREADLLPVGYFHVVVSIPAELADFALHIRPAEDLHLQDQCHAWHTAWMAGLHPP